MLGRVRRVTALVVVVGGLFFFCAKVWPRRFRWVARRMDSRVFQQDAVPRWDLDVAGRGGESAGGGV